MVIALKVILSIALLLVGLTVFEWGPRAIRTRRRVFDQFDGTARERSAHGFFLFWTGYTLSSGSSFALAAIVLWFRPTVAIVLVLWPFALMGFLQVTSNMRSGTCKR